MIKRIISLFISTVMAFSGIQLLSPDELIDIFFETLYGIPFTSSSIKGDFFSEIGENDIEVTGKNSGIVKNRLVVIIKSGTGFSQKRELLESQNLKAIGWCAPVDIFVVSCSQSDSGSIGKKCRSLMQNECVRLAMPLVVSKNAPQGTPNDQYYLFDDLEKCNWDELNPDGSEAWLEMINARQAWDYEAYYNPVKLGVVDTGFSTRHPELKGKITFPNFWQKLLNFPDYHGTHVAGIIAANRNDGIGVAGICSQATLCCVDWSPLISWNSSLSVLFGLAAEVKAGAKAINFSVGKSAAAESDRLEMMENVINADATLTYYFMSSLLEKGYDFLCIQSAGNGDAYGIPIDARYNGIFCGIDENQDFSVVSDIPYDEIEKRIIIVGSTGYDSEKGYVQSGFNNVGSRIDITAPGEEIISTITDKSYLYLSGTSMSTPMVTGAAGLIWSINPEFSAEEVRDIILSSTDRVSAKNDSLPEEADAIAKDIPVLNAKLCVEEALKRTYPDMGTVSGKIELNGEKNAVVSFNGKEYTVFSDGSFSFVSDSGSGTLSVVLTDGTEAFSAEITVAAGEITEVSSEPAPEIIE